MTILFTGIATTKLMRHDLPMDDPAQPWLVEIAAKLVSADFKTLAMLKRSVRLPVGAAVQAGAENVHHVSTKSARRSGAQQRWVCYGMVEMMNEAKVAVYFGDMTPKVMSSVIARVAESEADRWLRSWNRPGVEVVDLRTPATQICKLPFQPPREDGGYRWPSRAEAAEAILDQGACGLISAARAEFDSEAWTNLLTEEALFRELKSRDLIEVTS